MTRVKVFCEVITEHRNVSIRNVSIGGRPRQDFVKVVINADNKHGTQKMIIWVNYDRDEDKTNFSIYIPEEWEGDIDGKIIARIVADKLEEAGNVKKD